MLKKIALVFVGLTALLAGLSAVYYRIDGVPLAETREYMQGDDYRVETGKDGSLVFRPKAGNGRGLLIMHGAVIKPQSYARSAAFFANEGYTVYLPFGPGRMSIAAVDAAAARIPEFALQDWYAIGHSMGGMASLQLVRKLPDRFSAVALWAAAMPGDFSELNLPILFLWGDDDGLLGPKRYAATRARLPGDTVFETVKGANHREFAMYSHQILDGEGSLGWAAQIDLANQRTLAFFSSR